MSRAFHRATIPVVVALAGLIQLAGSADVEAQADAETAVVAVELQDRSGRPVDPSETVQLQATVGDQPLGVRTLAETRPWEIVLYVDQRLTGSRSILLLLEALADQAALLTDLGEVEIVLVDEGPRTVVRTADADLLTQVLLDLSLQSGGDQAIRYHRARFVGDLADDDDQNNALATEALAAELELLRLRQDQLIHWVDLQGRASGPRLLLMLNDGLGLDPFDFYGDHLASPATALLELGEPPDLEALAQTLASRSWTLAPVQIVPATDEEAERVSLRTNRSVGFRIGFGGRKDDEDEPEPPAPAELGLLLEDQRRRLESLAAETGGAGAPDLEGLPEALARLTRRRELLIALPEDTVDPLPVELAASRPSLRVVGPRWVGGTPENLAEVRIRRALEDGGEAGELPLRAKIHLDPERMAAQPAALEVEVDLSAIQTARPTVDLRVSVGVHTQDGELLLRHSVVTTEADALGTWSWKDDLPLPPATDAAIVVVHDLTGDLWGENFAEFLTATETTAAESLPVESTLTAPPAGPALRLLPLPTNTRTGKVRVRSEARRDVDEVVFMLDGQRAGVRRRAPFELRIDLGRTPRQQSIIAIAYDRSGNELGRDGLVVNEATTSFWIRIVEPRPGSKVGPVEVATSLKVPENRRLETVDYYWNDQRVDSTARAPHRSRVLIPVDSPAGFIRVVATLDDGSTAEDVVLMNTQRFETEINVELVELYVVVTDRLGKPVRDLEAVDFLVREEEEVQEVESFAVAGDLPLTLGLAIDSSLSLFKKLPEVQKAAKRFIGSLSDDRDRAFLVGFGSEPRVVHSITGNLDRIGRAIDTLTPSGNTAVWEAISLSLGQLDQVSGRKALVVFYDGDDEDEQYSFRKTMDQAKRSLIPVYLVVMNDEAARTQGQGFAVRSRISKLAQLARTGGGRVFFVRTDQDLTPIFQEIGDELRSHYLLTYYPQRPLANPEWRPIHVEMTRGDLEARTITGYGAE